MPPESLLSIGDLAERAGVTVKTVRSYSDCWLLPEAVRSSGGQRRYAPKALERLRPIGSLRTLDLPVPEVARFCQGDGLPRDVRRGSRRLNGRRAERDRR